MQCDFPREDSPRAKSARAKGQTRARSSSRVIVTGSPKRASLAKNVPPPLPPPSVPMPMAMVVAATATAEAAKAPIAQ